MVSCRNPAATRVDEDLKFIFVPQLSLHLSIFRLFHRLLPVGKERNKCTPRTYLYARITI